MKNLLYAALLGAALWILTEVLEMASAKGSTPLSLWLTTLWHPILALGFWGLHKRQFPAKNVLSLAGAILLILSLLAFAPVSILILYSEVNTFSEFLEQNPGFQVAGLASVAGYILFGIAVIRSRFYPGWMGYALIGAMLLSVVQTFGGLPDVVQHVAFIALSLVVVGMASFALQQ